MSSSPSYKVHLSETVNLFGSLLNEGDNPCFNLLTGQSQICWKPTLLESYLRMKNEKSKALRAFTLLRTITGRFFVELFL